MGMIFDASLDLSGVRKKGRDMLSKGGSMQKFVDSAVLTGVEPYLPMRSGSATKSGLLHSRIGQGLLVWKTPYIRYIWHGKLMVDPLTKKGAFYSPVYGYWSRPGVQKERTTKGLVFDRSRHPKAGPKWAIRYKADHLQELTKAIQERAREEWKNS